MKNHSAQDGVQQRNKFLIVGITAIIMSFLSQNLFAAPDLNKIAQGDVTIASQPNHLQINQNSDRAIIDWHSFNISNQERVHFQQPTHGICLNRIDAKGGMSQINGQLSATGKVVLINEAGIMFGQNAKINVGSIIASSIGISEENFANSNYKFDLPSMHAGGIINRGEIVVAEHGLAAFLGANVINDGIIQANMSQVILASGNKFTVDFYGNGMFNFAVDEAAIAKAVDENGNSLPNGVQVAGQIINAGDVLITGKATQDLFDNLINMSGFVQVTSATEKNGSIVLLGDSAGIVSVTGELNASGLAQDSKGGAIHVLGEQIVVDQSAQLIAQGSAGGGEILLGGDYKGNNPNVKNATSTYVGPSVLLNADSITQGNGGKIIAWSDDNTQFLGRALARGGASQGNGGFLEISSKKNLLYDGQLDLTAINGTKGTVLFDPRYLVVATTGGVAYNNGVNNLFANNIGSTNTLTPASIVAAAASANIILQANTDVVFTDALAIATSGSTLTVNAGRSVLFNANVSTTNAAITVTANDTSATSSDRNTTATGNPAGDTETTTGNITMTGAVTLSSGTGAISMTIGSSNTAPYSPGNISLQTVTGGAITLTTPGSLTTNNVVTFGTSLTVSTGAASTIGNADLAGTGNFILASTNTGTVTLTGNNTYTGTTTINGGSLSISNDRNFGAVPGAVTPGSIVFGGGTLISTASISLSNRRGIDTGTGATFAPATGTTFTIPSIIAGSGSLTLSGAGTLLLNVANTYTGATNITAGLLQAGAVNVIATSSALTLSNVAGATFDVNNRAQTIGSLSGGGNLGGNILSGNVALTINQTADGTYSGVISETGSLILSSSSTNTLTLAGVNTYTGTNTINGGTLSISQDLNLGSVPGAPVAAELTINGGTLRTTASFTLNANRGITLGASSGTLQTDPSTILTYNGIVAGTGSLIKSGTGTLVLGGVNTYTALTTINAGTLSISQDRNLGAIPGGVVANEITLNGSTLETTATFTINSNRGITIGASNGTIQVDPTFTTTYNGIITSTGGSLTKSGSGMLQLGGVNTYTGATNVTAGTLQTTVANSIANTNALTMSNVAGAIFDLNNFNQIVGTLSGGGTTGGNISLGSATLTINQTVDGTYAGVISGTGSLILSSSSTNTLTLTGTNTYGGTNTINGGTLSISQDLNLGSVPGAPVANELTINGGTLRTTASFALNSNRGITLGASNGTFLTDPSTTLTYNGIVAGTGSLIKSGTGTLVLGGVNTYAALTTINAGILSISQDLNLGAAPVGVVANELTLNGGTLETTASFTINSNRGITIGASNGTILVDPTFTTTYNGIITGTGGSLTKSGAGILQLGGINTYTGATNVTAGTLQTTIANSIANSNALTMSNVAGAIFDLNNFNQAVSTLSGGGTTGGNITLGSATLTVTQGTTQTYAGVISGTGGLTKAGSATLTLSGTNTYSGNTTINAGTLQAGAANVIANTSPVILANVASAIFDLNNFNQSISNLSGGGITGGNVTLGSGTLTVNETSNTNYSGVISGSGGLTKAGSATLTLGGTNTYTGTTTINAGTLQAGITNVIANSTALTFANTAGAIFDLNNLNQSVGSLSGGGTTGGNITLGNATLTVTQSTTGNYAGVISGTGNVIKAGSSTLTLSNSNLYSGTTTINAGTLQAGATNVIANSSSLTLANTVGVVFDLNNFNQSIGTLSGGGANGGNITLGSGTLTVAQGSAQTYAGVISGTGGLTKNGTFTLILSGINTYSGTTTINDGTLKANATNVIANTSALTLANVANAIFDLNSFSQTVGTLSGGGVTGGNITLGSGTLSVNQSSNASYSGVISGSGGLTKNGAFRLTLGNTNTYVGETDINAGILQAGSVDVIATSNGVVLANVSGASFDLNNFNQAINTLSGGGTSGGNITLGSATLSVSQNSNAGYLGIISGTGGLTKLGSSILTLEGANSYTGTTAINAGTLEAGAANIIASTSPVTLANTAGVIFDLAGFDQSIGTLSGGGATGGNITLNSATLAINQGANTAYAGVINGTGNLTKNGNFTLTLSNNNLYTGTTTINAGTLQAGVANAISNSSPVTLANVANAIFNLNNFNQSIGSLSGGGTTGGNVTLGSASLTVTQSASANYAGVISGTGSFTKAGGSTLTLSGVNTYSGVTTINAGSLQAGATNVIASSSALTLANTSGATFALNSFNQSIGTLSGGGLNGGNITLGSATLIVNQTGSGTYSGVISGTGGLTLSNTSTNTLTLAGTNTYSGTTNINGGTLSVGADANLGTAPGSVTANNIAFNGGTLETTATFTLNSNRGITLNASGGTVQVDPTFATTYSGIITGSGALTKTGTGIFELGGSNTYSGATNINAGTLRILASNVLPNNSAVALANVAGVNLDLNNFNQTIATLSGGGATGGNILLGSGTLTVNENSGATYAGVISGTGGLTKNGNATLILSGTNTYTGTTAINAGTLQCGAANVIASTSPVTLANTAGAIFDLNSFSQSVGSLSGGGTTGGNITLGSGTLTVNQATNATYGGVINGSGALIKNGGSILTLSNTNTYTGATTINAGTLQAGATNVIANSSALTLANVAGTVFDLNNFNQTVGTLSGGGTTGGNITLGSATLTVTQGADATYSGTISGSGGLTKNGNFRLTLGSSNPFTGPTVINSGILQAATADIIINSNGLTIANTAGTSFDLNNFNQHVDSLSGGGTTGGNITLGSATLTVDQFVNGTYGGVISGTGSLTLSNEATSKLTLSGANTYSGGTTIDGSTLSISADNNLGAAPGVVTPANLTFNGGILETTATFTLNANRGIDLNSHIGTVQVDPSTTLTYNGIMAGTGSFTKLGTGTLILGGVNTFTGDTVVSAGLLQAGVANIIANSSSVTIANAASTSFDLNNFNQAINSLSGGGTTGGNIALGSATLSVTQNANATYAGVISGTGGLTKLGSSTLTLDNVNTYTGPTNISNGTLQADIANVFATSSQLILANAAGATFNLNSFNQSIGTLSGGGTLGGNISLGSATLTVTQGSGQTYSGIISGTGGFTKNGAAMLTIAGVNTYSGTTTINAGTLQCGAANVLPNTNHLILTNATGAALDLNNFSQSIHTLEGGGALGGNILLGSATLTINQTANATYSGVISGTGSLVKSGTFTLILTGTNTYSGSTTINTGKLQAGATNVIANSSALNLANNNATFDLNNFNQNVGTLSGGGSAGGNITFGSATLTVNQSGNAAYGGIMSGTGGLIKAGSSTLILSGANTYTGATNINAGTLQAGRINAITNSSSVTLANVAGASFNLNGFNQTINTLSGGGVTGGNIALGGATLTINEKATGVYAGVISGTGNLILSSASTNKLTLSGTNTYSGSITIDGSTLSISSDSNLGTAPGSPTANSIVFNGGTLENTATFTLDPNRGMALNGSGGTIQVDPTFTVTYEGIIAGSGSLTKTGTGTLELSGANTFTGATAINAGTIQAGAADVLATSSSVTLANATGTVLDLNGFNQTITNLSGGGTTGGNITLGAGTLTFNETTNTTYAGVISGTGGITKSGSSTLTLSNANTYSGTTNVNTGTLQIANAGGLGNTNGTAVTSGATLNIDLTSATLTNSNTITLNGNGVSSGGALTFSGSNITLNNPITVASNSSIGGSASGTISFSGTISGANNLGVTLNNATMHFSALNVGGTATLTGYNATGSVNVGGLALDTSFANLNGFVAGKSGQAAINIIQVLNTIYEGTHFFDGIDMSTTPAPSPTPTVSTQNKALQSIFAYLYFNYDNDYGSLPSGFNSNNAAPSYFDSLFDEQAFEVLAPKHNCLTVGGVLEVCSAHGNSKHEASH